MSSHYSQDYFTDDEEGEDEEDVGDLSFCLDDDYRRPRLFDPSDSLCIVNELVNGYPSSSTPKMTQDEIDSLNGVDTPRNHFGATPIKLRRPNSYDPNLFNIREVNPEKIAEQMTLIDLALMKNIMREEFDSCSWTKKDKQMTSPNIVAMSQRFNHTSFLVVRGILNERNVKLRGEIVAHFIKVARRLLELNNLHSLVAVIGAIQSPPIARLQSTWKHIPKRDRSTLDRLIDLLSEKDNYEALRQHLHSIEHSPHTIPHLGLHQRDLVYLDSMRKRSNTSTEEIAKYDIEITKILDFIQKCQSSKYDNLMPHLNIQKYLNSALYINEFQKFFEEENYKLSLQIEPPARKSLRAGHAPHHSSSHPLRNSKSSEDLITPLKPEITGPAIATPPRRPLSTRFSESDIRKSNDHLAPPTFTPLEISLSTERLQVPRSVATLPVNLAGKDWRVEMGKVLKEVKDGDHVRKTKSSSPSQFGPGGGRRKIGHLKSQSLGNNVLAVLGIKPTSRGSSPELPGHNVSLLDGSLLEAANGVGGDGGVVTSVSLDYTTPSVSVGSNSPSVCTGVSSNEEEEEEEERGSVFNETEDKTLSVDPSGTEIIFDGILKRRVLKKSGKTFPFKRNQDYWVQLTPTYIILLPHKYKDSKKAVDGSNLKYISLFGSRVRHGDPLLKLKDNQFILMDSQCNETKFTGVSSSDTHQWVDQIRSAIINEEDRLRRQEEEKPLIKF